MCSDLRKHGVTQSIRLYVYLNILELFVSEAFLLRDCSLFGGPVFRVGGGVKFSKSMKKMGLFFKNTNKGRG